MIVLENRFFPIRSAVCFLVEGGIILLSVMISYHILNEGEPGTVTFHNALARGVVIAVFCQACMYLLDLYDLKIYQTVSEIFFSLIFAVGFLCIGIGLISYIVPGFGVGGKMYYLTVLFITILLLAWRVSFGLYLEKMAPKENVLVVGTGDVARMVANELKLRERLGFRLLGFIGPLPDGDRRLTSMGSVLGDYSDLESVVREKKVKKIVVAIAERRGKYPVKEMLSLKVAGINVIEWPSYFERLSGRIPIDSLAPSFFIFNEGFRKSQSVLVIRRIFSVVTASCLILLLSPVLLVIAILIRFDSPGKVLYSQIRVGQKGKHIRIYKFRSMIENAEVNGKAQWATKDDPRVTRLGRILRRARLDELPQLFNVIKGDLDIVGPRPERPEFVQKLEELIPYYSLRHTVKPGLTGWAQVMFTYSGTFEESKEKFQYDLFYLKNLSIKLDMLILFQTLKIAILGRGAV